MRNTWCMLVAVVGVGVASAAWADGIADLVPDAPGPYTPGEQVSVDAVFTSLEDAELLLRGITVSPVENTDATISVDDFAFIDASDLYAQFPSLPEPSMVWTLPMAIPEEMIALPPGAPVTIATLGVTVNDTGTLSIFPATLSFGFGVDPDDPMHEWNSDDGTLTGGSLDMPVPEPATLALLALGAGVALRRRAAA